MNLGQWIEIYGYLGSILVVVSMLMSSIVKLRVVNTIGSIISGTYALIIGSYPLALMNGALIVINIYNLIKLKKSDNIQYHLVEAQTNDSVIAYFLNYYKQDIKQYFPEIDKDIFLADTAYIVYYDSTMAGILLGKMNKNGTMDICLDYTTPMYRDCSVGSYLYSKLSNKGIRKLAYSGNSEKHISYLQKMGFKKTNGIYEKNLG